MAGSTQISGRRLEAALAGSAELGPYFANHGAEGTAVLPPQQLYEPQQLASLLTAVGKRIGTEEGRVAASTLQYGLAARCWSLMLGTWQCGRLVLDLRGLGFVVTASESVELALIDATAWDYASASADDAAERIIDTVVPQLDSLHAALRTVTRVADGLLWGNAASSLVSATQIVSAKHPGGEISAVTTSIMRHRPLLNRLVEVPPEGIRRRSCCLWYRTADKTHCGDCPLTPRT